MADIQFVEAEKKLSRSRLCDGDFVVLLKIAIEHKEKYLKGGWASFKDDVAEDYNLQHGDPAEKPLPASTIDHHLKGQAKIAAQAVKNAKRDTGTNMPDGELQALQRAWKDVEDQRKDNKLKRKAKDELDHDKEVMRAKLDETALVFAQRRKDASFVESDDVDAPTPSTEAASSDLLGEFSVSTNGKGKAPRRDSQQTLFKSAFEQQAKYMEQSTAVQSTLSSSLADLVTVFKQAGGPEEGMETLKHRLNGHEDLLKRQGETLEAQTAMLDSQSSKLDAILAAMGQQSQNK